MSTIIDDKVVASAKGPCEIKQDPIIALTEKVDSLYHYRDHYFENHVIEDAINKNSDIEKEMKETLAKFDEYNGYEIEGSRAKYYYLKGKTFNVVDRFIPQAEELLSKAVKLEPKLIDAWNELGECYWKKDDIKQAKNCFVGALPHGRNKTSLRNLSMVLRQEAVNNHRQKVDNIRQGVEYAKEAVALDTMDGQSWTILGKRRGSKSKPYLFFNKATALKYQEEYKQALEAFERAFSLDPTWDVPRTKWEDLLKYLKDVQNLISSKGRLKTKRLHQMVLALDKKHMGPYKNGSYTSGEKTIKLELTPLENLKEGLNIEKVVFGKVVCWIQNTDAVPFTFCMVDEHTSCLAVTVYNLAEGRGVTVGDSIAIPEPFLTHHKFSYSRNEFDFKSIRVETPVVLVVNGKKLGRDQQASVQLSSFKRSD
ncbi:hypothetical protein G9C98_006748 [Cotesia typhae]|uniref:Tetratricopeptide repeat protein 5 OB fold domain-containing protein n=1 Tax=Cotesia typhae TaxID=2053667 RepID=A0A8J5QWG0_9HYME|nr:hypothetical protein G9C98_006748 [Cotesia typhae]